MKWHQAHRLAAASVALLLAITPAFSASTAKSPDGTIWTAQSAADRIVRQTPGSEPKVAVQLAHGAKPIAVVVGADGSIWFTAQGLGTVTQYQPGTDTRQDFPAGAAPRGLAMAANGDLWVTQAGGKSVGRLSAVDHSYTELGLGASLCCTAADVVAGADGSIWLSDERGQRFAFINPATPQVVQSAPDLRRASAQAGAGSAVFDFAGDAFEVNELCDAAIVTVRRSGDLSTSVRVKFTTSDGTARAFDDYDPRSGELLFPPNVTTQEFRVNIRGDRDNEDVEDVLLSLLEPSDGAMLGSQSTSLIRIFDESRINSGFGEECSDGGGRGGRGNGGCTIGSVRDIDPVLPLAAAGSASFLVWRRRKARAPKS